MKFAGLLDLPAFREKDLRVERAREIAAGEERWHYISFANDGGFLGGLLIRGYGTTDALARSWEQGLNPGDCEAQIFRLMAEAPVPDDLANRLLSKDEVLALNQLMPERRNPS